LPEPSPSEPAAQPAAACPDCGTELGGSLLTCPSCHGLVHRDTLKRLAGEAEQAAAAGDLSGARDTWRRALELLPPSSRQSTVVAEKVVALGEKIDAGLDAHGRSPRGDESPDSRPPGEGTAGWLRALGPLGAAALVLWKLKWIVVLVFSKAKLLLLGLTKTTTLLSMLLSLGVYWTVWGWRFALGLVLSMYVHEMGHVAALRRYGIKASAPMFIPGIGAMVRLKQYPATAGEDARVGLAGPLWGLGASLVAWAAFAATASPYWAAIARSGAWLNLFNLLPVWQLDGGRGFGALSAPQRWLVTGVCVVLWVTTREGLLVLLALAGVVQALGRSPERPDDGALAQFVFLLVALAALTRIAVPGLPTR
jgi:Zn-dependent protease